LRLHLAICKTCQSYMSQLERLGQFVKLAAADAQASVAQPDFDRAFGSIERALKLETETALALEPKRDRVVAERSSAPTTVHAPRTSSLRARVERRWVQRGAPALGAFALAAAALLMVYRQDGTTLTGETGGETPTGHSEIVDVDFGSNAGTVFDIPMSDGPSIPVVWIDDDDDDEE
jgi:hypothetical protein